MSFNTNFELTKDKAYRQVIGDAEPPAQCLPQPPSHQLPLVSQADPQPASGGTKTTSKRPRKRQQQQQQPQQVQQQVQPQPQPHQQFKPQQRELWPFLFPTPAQQSIMMHPSQPTALLPEQVPGMHLLPRMPEMQGFPQQQLAEQWGYSTAKWLEFGPLVISFCSFCRFCSFLDFIDLIDIIDLINLLCFQFLLKATQLIELKSSTPALIHSVYWIRIYQCIWIVSLYFLPM